MTTAKQAKAVARRWVEEEGAASIPGFGGVFLHGSINWLPDDAALPANSDVDVMVVLSDVADTPGAARRGKFRYGGVLLEVSYLPADAVASAEQVLGRYDLAGSFAGAASGVLADPSGRLAELHAAVSRDYARRHWVLARCDDARDRVLRNLAGLDAALREDLPFHEQVVRWLFAAGVTTHVLLVAGLRNPTVRTRYVAVRDLLREYGRGDFYESLLGLLDGNGREKLKPGRVAHHVKALAGAFDAAKSAIQSPFPFAADISDEARPVAIDGSEEMVARGDHREALFWIVATYSRCLQVLHADADSATRERFTPGYRELLADIGIASSEDLGRRGRQVREHLPGVREVAEAILAANPAVVD